MTSGGELAYQQLCGEITAEFNDCSKQVILPRLLEYFSMLSFIAQYMSLSCNLQVLEMESLLMMPDLSRDDLANLLKAVQAQEKQKLHLVIDSSYSFWAILQVYFSKRQTV